MYDEDMDITEETMQGALCDLLAGYTDSSEIDWADVRVRTFEDAGVLTYNKGLVISLPDGSEFQLTIVQSR